MPFSEEFLNNASKQVVVASVQDDFEVVKKLIERAVAKVAEQMPHVLPKHVEIYMHGSYANKTNISFPSNLEICVELTKTATYDPKEPQRYTIHHNYFIEHPTDFSPRDFRQLLYAELSKVVEGKIGQNDKCIVLPPFAKIRRNVEITPCFTFNYIEGETNETLSAVFKGVLLFDKKVGEHIVTFPRIHQKNGETKDIVTGGNFKKTVRTFKTLNAIYSRENEVESSRGYFIECMLYNVPDQMFRGGAMTQSGSTQAERGIMKDIVLKVLNWLNNCSVEEFVCQNLVWKLFGVTDEFWKVEEARNFIKAMKEMYETFPAERTLLA